MPHGSRRDRECPECGGVVAGLKWAKGDRFCRECGLRRAVTAALEMSHRDGVAWRRWQRSNATGAKGAPVDRED